MNEILFSYFYSFAHRSAALDGTIVFIAADLLWVVLIGLFFYLLKDRDKRTAIRDIVVVFGAGVMGRFAALVLKNIFHTARPFVSLSSVRQLIAESGYAFPSGHAMLLSAISGALWMSGYRRSALLFGFFALLVGVARIAAGVHWPVDILGGLALGFLTGVAIYYSAMRVLFSR